jgi:hypothetical protein
VRAKLVNYGLYQAGWFCCVLAAAHERPWWGVLAGLALIAAHVALLARPAAELRLLLVAGLLGAVVDSLQSCAGLLVFRSGYVAGCLAPPWIVVMWMQFATLFGFSLSFLRGRHVLSAALAAVGGPLAFWVGGRLGAVEFPAPTARSLLVLGVVWAAAVPFLVWVAERSYARGPAPAYRRAS